MWADLSQFQSHVGHHDAGRLTAPDQSVFVRRSTKASHKAADALVADGVPVVLDLYSSAQFEWFDGEDAHKIWAQVRPYVVTSAPRRSS